MAPEERPPLVVDLRLHSTREGLPDGHNKGRGAVVRALWLLLNALVLRNPVLRAYGLKARLLRSFGASIGDGVVIKPGVSVKYPWYLTVGDHSWIGERVWLDCGAPLRIGSHVVVSQGTYVSCGKHDWSDRAMSSVAAPVVIEDGAWLSAFVRVGPGVTIGQEAVVAMGTVVITDCVPRGTYRGNPMQRVGERRFRNYAAARR